MTSVDRIQGLSGSLAVKAPCRVATLANITLSGLQTIDGISVVAGDRVLVKNQTLTADNGIYVASTSGWQRALDFNGPYDAVVGTIVLVNEGASEPTNNTWRVTSIGVIGANGITFGPGGESLRADLAAPSGSSLVGYLSAGVGAVATDVQSKLRQLRTSSDFPDLATAIATYGSAKTKLMINSPVTVSADLTIPDNIDVRVEGLGLITVATGKRLYINGSFSAPKLHKCFDAPLLSTTITASISDLGDFSTLIVTAVSNSVLAAGHVITGGGLAEGATIAQTWISGGAGTYTLNGDWGAIGSTTFTATGASVIFGSGVVDQVHPEWFGAKPGTATDSTDAIRHAVYSQQWGGEVQVSAGAFKVTGSTVLHGGLSIVTNGVADITTGSPSPNETAVPAHIWQATDNKAIFVVPVRADKIAIRNLSLGASEARTGIVPIGTGRRGILFNGRAPQFTYAPDIDNCYFYHLERGIDVNDSLAASGTNWGVNPGLVRSCQFNYCTYGSIFYTDNADAWKFDQCVFILPANGSGIHLIRCGFIKLDTCFAFGGSLANSEFIKVAPIETGNPIDTITIDNCQAEYCSHFITTGGANTRAFDINIYNSIPQLGTDIYLGSPCNFNSQNNHLMAFVYYDHADVKINTINDWFEFQNFVSGATWNFVNAGSGDANAIKTYIPGAFPSSTLGVNAKFAGSAINSIPTVQTVDNYAVTNADVTVIINRASPTTIVLPFGYLFPGRRIRVVTRQAQTVVSSQGNITPIIGGAATTAILAATAGKWVDLESDGTYWLVTAGN